MADVTTVSNKKQILEIIQALFLKHPLTLLLGAKETPVKDIQMVNGVLTVSPGHSPEIKACRLKLQHGKRLLVLECNILEHRPGGKLTLTPQSLMAAGIAMRKEARHKVPDAGVKRQKTLLTNCISQREFQNYLAEENEKRLQIVQTYAPYFQKTFSKYACAFRESLRLDARMRSFIDKGLSIFMPNRMSKDLAGPPECMPFEDYTRIADMENLNIKVVSEICIPFKYHGVFVFGYMLLQGEAPISKDSFEEAREIADEMNREFEVHKSVPTASDKCLVTDISHSGLGFLHPHNPNKLRSLQPGETIVFDVHFPGIPRVSFMGEIKNLSMLKNSYRLGLEFKELTAEQKEHVDKYVDENQKPE